MGWWVIEKQLNERPKYLGKAMYLEMVPAVYEIVAHELNRKEFIKKSKGLSCKKGPTFEARIKNRGRRGQCQGINL